jgi:DNA polymerase III subunit delta'
VILGDQPLLPWHKDSWDLVNRARRAGRVPHALLVTGPFGVGKRQLVERLAHSLLCSRPDEQGLACGKCRDCELLAAGTHADYNKVGPDPQSKSDEIKVDAVRRLAESDGLTAHRGGYKVIVLDPAQNMNASSANSLLKTLEEPSPNTLLCLVCEQPGRLPATIRSRCQELKIPVPAEAEALAWLRGQTDSPEVTILLRLAHGAPLKALVLADEARLPQREQAFAGFAEIAKGLRDPITEAAAWNKHDPAILLDWLSGWVCDLLRLASGHPSPELTNPDKSVTLRSLAEGLDSAAGHRYLRRVLAARESAGTTINRLLLYESLLVEWAMIHA